MNDLELGNRIPTVLDIDNQAGEPDRMTKTKWWGVTGGPGTGKTTLLEYLSQKGYKTMPEAARVLIDREMDKGRRMEAIRANEFRFQENVLPLKYQLEEESDPEQLIFWDRVVDGDSQAYSPVPTETYYGRESVATWHHEQGNMVILARNRYQGIFLLDRIPQYKNDYARIEDESQAHTINEKIGWQYRRIGYPVIRVPVFSSNEIDSIQKRARFIIDTVREADPSIPAFVLSPDEPIQLPLL